MKNILLIGMPGSGKTTIGTLLAERLGYGYIDSDSLIVAKAGKRLNEIIAEVGTEAFLDIEAEVNASIYTDNCVIATGGSAIYRDYAMQALGEKGLRVYLQLSYEEIARRLGDLKTRGVAIKEGNTLKDLYEERVPLYEKYADLTVSLDGKSVEECVHTLMEAIKCKRKA